MKRPRETLIEIFKDGKVTGRNYVDLIESTVNIETDGIDFDKDNGLKLTAKGSSQKLMSFYEAMNNDRSPAFTLHLNPDNQKGLNITEGRDRSRVFIQTGGNIGVGTTKPAYDLDVQGLVGMRGRVGNFATGYMPADGDWHTIKDNLNGCMGFEIMAHINDEADERFALTHAILLMSGGKKRGAKTQTKMVMAGSRWFWSRFWNKIVFRWKLDEENTNRVKEKRYLLQIKTRTHYGTANGEPKQIFYRAMQLWDRNFEQEVYVSPLEQQTASSHSRPNPARPQVQQPPRNQPEPDPGAGKFRINKR